MKPQKLELSDSHPPSSPPPTQSFLITERVKGAALVRNDAQRGGDKDLGRAGALPRTHGRLGRWVGGGAGNGPRPFGYVSLSTEKLCLRLFPGRSLYH